MPASPIVRLGRHDDFFAGHGHQHGVAFEGLGNIGHGLGRAQLAARQIAGQRQRTAEIAPLAELVLASRRTRRPAPAGCRPAGISASAFCTARLTCVSALPVIGSGTRIRRPAWLSRRSTGFGSSAWPRAAAAGRVRRQIGSQQEQARAAQRQRRLDFASGAESWHDRPVRQRHNKDRWCGVQTNVNAYHDTS